MRKSHFHNITGSNLCVEPTLILFSLAFLAGAAGGYFACQRLGTSTELQEYLNQYAQVLASGATLSSASLLYVAAAYFRMPCIVYLCSFFRRAIYLAGGVFLAEGFLLSFAIVNFTLAMGRVGVLLSLCVFGVRAVFILPVSLSVILRLRAENGRRGRRSACSKARIPKQKKRALLLYPVILALGVMAELTFVPKLVAFALQKIS